MDVESDSDIDYDGYDENFKVLFHFKEEKEPIFCCDFNQSGNLVAFGSGRDTLYIYDIINNHLIIEAGNVFYDSVISVAFNHDSLLCAGAAMNGNVQVWDIIKQTCVFSSISEDQTFLFWHSAKNILVLGTTSGNIYLWHIKTNNQKILPGFRSSSSSASFIKNNHLLVAYHTGILKLWNVREESVLCQLKLKIAEIYQMSMNENGTLALVYGMGKYTKLISISDNAIKDVAQFEQNNECDSIEAAIFIQSFTDLIVIGNSNGHIVVWDLLSHSIRYEINIYHSVTIICHLIDSVVVIGTNDGFLYFFDCKNGQIVNDFQCCTKAVLGLKFHKNSNSIAVCFDNGSLKVFQLKSAFNMCF